MAAQVPKRLYCLDCGKPAVRRRNLDGKYKRAGDECGREEGHSLRLPCPGILTTERPAEEELA